MYSINEFTHKCWNVPSPLHYDMTVATIAIVFSPLHSRLVPLFRNTRSRWCIDRGKSTVNCNRMLINLQSRRTWRNLDERETRNGTDRSPRRFAWTGTGKTRLIAHRYVNAISFRGTPDVHYIREVLGTRVQAEHKSSWRENGAKIILKVTFQSFIVTFALFRLGRDDHFTRHASKTRARKTRGQLRAVVTCEESRIRESNRTDQLIGFVYRCEKYSVFHLQLMAQLAQVDINIVLSFLTLNKWNNEKNKTILLATCGHDGNHPDENKNRSLSRM